MKYTFHLHQEHKKPIFKVQDIRNKPVKFPPGGGGVLPTMVYTGKLLPKGALFRLQVYKRVGNSIAEVYERVGIFFGLEKGP